MAGQNSRNKDKEMAAYLKAKGVKRTTTQCPHGHHTVGLNSLAVHLMTCMAGIGGRHR